jgi:hypothetical protein
MSADRELLELAAKAAGIDGFFVDAGLNAGSNAFPKVWNPLTDDGDAFRLAVKLNFNVCKREHEVEIFNDDNGEFLCSISISEGDDPCAATRRAIVRAAAEIGRATP